MSRRRPRPLFERSRKPALLRRPLIRLLLGVLLAVSVVWMALELAAVLSR